MKQLFQEIINFCKYKISSIFVFIISALLVVVSLSSCDDAIKVDEQKLFIPLKDSIIRIDTVYIYDTTTFDSLIIEIRNLKKTNDSLLTVIDTIRQLKFSKPFELQVNDFSFLENYLADIHESKDTNGASTTYLTTEYALNRNKFTKAIKLDTSYSAIKFSLDLQTNRLESNDSIFAKSKARWVSKVNLKVNNMNLFSTKNIEYSEKALAEYVQVYMVSKLGQSNTETLLPKADFNYCKLSLESATITGISKENKVIMNITISFKDYDKLRSTYNENFFKGKIYFTW